MQCDINYRQGYGKALIDFADWLGYHGAELRANRVPIRAAEKLAILFAENVDWFMELGREAPVTVSASKGKYTFGREHETDIGCLLRK